MLGKSIPCEAVIKWIKKESRDTSTYALKILDKEIQKRFQYTPGQFNMLSIPGIGEAPISFSSAPSDHDMTHTVRVAGDLTTALSRLNAGDVIGLRGPFGRGWPLQEIYDRELLIIAGGLGIAPLRSVIREILKKHGRNFCKKPPVIIYGSKTPKDILFRNEFPRYKDIFDVFFTVNYADPEEYWKGETGIVTDVLKKITFNPINSVVFMCGPESMMQASVRSVLMMGVPGEKIFFSLERNMNCGMGICGHCFFGPKFVCKDGPVFRYTEIEEFLRIQEI